MRECIFVTNLNLLIKELTEFGGFIACARQFSSFSYCSFSVSMSFTVVTDDVLRSGQCSEENASYDQHDAAA